VLQLEILAYRVLGEEGVERPSDGRWITRYSSRLNEMIGDEQDEIFNRGRSQMLFDAVNRLN
jgi:hypothetical protein